MKKITLVALTIAMLLCIVGETNASIPRLPFPRVLPGIWHEAYGLGTCSCPYRPASCFCFVLSRSHGEPLDLTMLDSFEGEDEEYLYFSATIREDTDPPVFDITMAGDAKVRISKQQLKQYLMEEE